MPNKIAANGTATASAAVISSILALAQSGCSAGAPLVVDHDSVATHERNFRGVVNGLWRFDKDQNSKRLLNGYLPPENASMASTFADRYQVRVGIERGVLFTRFSEIAILPIGWEYSLDKVVNNGHTVNIGDLVDIQTVIGTKITSVVTIVRKCDQAPRAGEDPDWNIGCKLDGSFGSNDYAGEKYYLRVF